MRALGDDVISFLGTAQRNVLIVAPFIRKEALIRLLDSIPADTKTTIVTRWRLADLLSGASDLDVYDVTEPKGIELYLRCDLHAKFFAADDRCLVGSANVTNTALGWRTPFNLELLVPVNRTVANIVQFENQLFEGAVRATSEQRARLARLLEQLCDSNLSVTFVEDDELSHLRTDWIPRIRNPDELYSVYKGDSDVGRATQEVMQEELKQLGVIPGMGKEMFREWVAAAINQTPLIQKVVSCIEQQGEVTESDISVFLTEIGVNSNAHQPRDILKTLERWLTYFLPTRYETARDSIKLIKAKTL